MPRHAKKPAARSRASRRPTVQYTVRDVPAHVDLILRRRAMEEGTSLNRLLRDALAHAAGAEGGAPLHHDLDALAGTWEDDPEFDRAIADQDRVDEALWR
jgi:hypothetical protein